MARHLPHLVAPELHLPSNFTTPNTSPAVVAAWAIQKANSRFVRSVSPDGAISFLKGAMTITRGQSLRSTLERGRRTVTPPAALLIHVYTQTPPTHCFPKATQFTGAEQSKKQFVLLLALRFLSHPLAGLLSQLANPASQATI